jgi:DNA-directed RNA polymerase specialized sigma24 family protein
MREVRRRYWDEGYDGWIHSEPERSAEDEYFYLNETDDAPDYTAEAILAMNRLTAKQRWVIECRYGFRTEGRPMQVEEIADLMGVSHVSVVKLIQRAEERLAEGYKETGAIEG